MHPLRTLLDNAARGVFPPADGLVEVLPAPDGVAGAALGLTGHFVIAADIDVATVQERMPPGDFSVPMAPATLTWLGEQIRAQAMTFDALFCCVADGGGEPAWLHEVDHLDHPRARRAARYRSDMRLFVADGDAAILAIGRGVCDRWEMGFEVAPSARGSGLGRAVARAAASLVPAGEFLWAQVAPGNAASMRAMHASGFRPVGAEVLFIRAAHRVRAYGRPRSR